MAEYNPEQEALERQRRAAENKQRVEDRNTIQRTIGWLLALAPSDGGSAAARDGLIYALETVSRRIPDPERF